MSTASMSSAQRDQFQRDLDLVKTFISVCGDSKQSPHADITDDEIIDLAYNAYYKGRENIMSTTHAVMRAMMDLSV